MSIADKLTQIAENEQKVFDAGKKAEYDAFWDAVQDHGKRKNYNFAFSASMYTQETFKRRHPIKPSSIVNGFAYWGQSGYPKSLIDLRAIDLDLSECTMLFNIFFDNRQVSAVGVLDCRLATNYQSLFNGALNLEIVEKLMLENTGAMSFSNTFQKCPLLRTINIEGVIGKDIDFQSSTLLSHDSIVSVINALSATATGRTATFSKTAVQNAFETSEGAADGSTSEEWLNLIATKPNWTISLV